MQMFGQGEPKSRVTACDQDSFAASRVHHISIRALARRVKGGRGTQQGASRSILSFIEIQGSPGEL